MKHLVVVAHPAEDSFTMGLTRAYAAELEKLGHSQQTYDLYRMGFNPVLAARELAPASADHPPCSDVAQAQDDIRSADVLTVIYPLWWMSMPAMMKGYIDRVFARGFAYESHNGLVRGLLSGKKAVLITISGAPLRILIESGNWKAVEILQDTHIFRSAGFDLLEHLHFDEVAPDLPRSIADQHMARVRSCAARHFPPPSAV
ncbi:NAD(P)H-dependent oxidoreductase [Methylocapsa polymorpha]|uniref:NAD(P)H-dependent oxidoreductase n=1 Tax=Methylocapsa polymorpha TaxID=3080828 RepID=A0ABZ0HN41_9HYPH|nr:NAD(P)H-dependent oxidoreductase [Methylocapsa sp. RX1]